MKSIKIAVVLAALLFAANAHALTLSWGAVTLGADGSVLPADQAVTQYNVYRCGSSANCSKSAGTKIGVVMAPAVSIDITSQPIPSSYVVTAVNLVGESDDSAPLKVTPPMAPSGPKVK